MIIIPACAQHAKYLRTNQSWIPQDTPNGDGSAKITGFWFQLSNIAVS
jgi:hypothetical protein